MLNNFKTLKFIILTSCISLFLYSCGSQKEHETSEVKTVVDSTKITLSNIPDESIFNLQSKWITQHDDSISLIKFANKITVAAMIFTHCQSACPRIVADIQRIENALTSKEKEQVRFLLISMDPERDTPPVFREFSKEHGLNEHWTLISSTMDATVEIANVLGVKVKKLSDGGFDHSNTIYILNKKGVVAYQQNGLEVSPDETLKQIRLLQ